MHTFTPETCRFRAEIVPTEAVQVDEDGDVTDRIVVTEDEGIRAQSTAQSLGKLKPAFKPVRPIVACPVILYLGAAPFKIDRVGCQYFYS